MIQLITLAFLIVLNVNCQFYNENTTFLNTEISSTNKQTALDVNQIEVIDFSSNVNQFIGTFKLNIFKNKSNKTYQLKFLFKLIFFILV